MPKYRLTAGSHVGPDSKGVMRMWTAKSGHDVIDTDQDLNSLNARGFPPKFQPLHEAPADEASLLAQRAEIDARLARIASDKSGGTPTATAPVADGAPLAPPSLKDPRDSVSPAVAARDAVAKAKSDATAGVLAACERMDIDELRAYCDGEEIAYESNDTKSDLLRAVAARYS